MDFKKDLSTNKMNNICVKKFNDEDNNYTDILMIYNDKVGNYEINKQILDKTGLFDLNWGEDLKIDIFNSKLKRWWK